MRIDRISDLERAYAMQSLDGQFKSRNNYKFVQTPDGYEHAYWSAVFRLNTDDLSWYDFRRSLWSSEAMGYIQPGN